MKKYIFLSVLLVGLCIQHVHGQFYGIKTNTLQLATGTLNAGVEISVAKQWSIDVSVYWNPIKTERFCSQFCYVQPSVRYWLFEHFVGHFVAVHPASGRYEIGNNRWRYKGWFMGVGASYGYTWILSKQWNLTAEAGLGFYFMRDKKRMTELDDWTPETVRYSRRVEFAPSKVELSVTYLF